jgi:hypothetical protein
MEDLLSRFNLPIIERELTSVEKEALIHMRDGADAPRLHSCIRWSVVWVTLVVISVVALRQIGFEASAFICPGLSLAVLLLITWAGFLDHHSSRARNMRKTADAALKGGKARVVRIESNRAILVKEVEDEGHTILLDIGSSATLVLCGQEWYGALNDGWWPSTTIEVVETTDPPMFLGPFSYGDPFDTLLRLDPCDPKHKDASAWITESLGDAYATLYDRPFDDICQQIESRLS